MTAARDNSDKPRLSDLFHFGIALDRLVSHMNTGRAKYPDVDGAPNFLLGGKPDQEYLDCMMRHIRCIQQGEVTDSEGFDHLSAIAWNALAMGVCNYPLTPPTPADRMMKSGMLQPINVDQTRPAFVDWTSNQGTNRPDLAPALRSHLSHPGQWIDCDCWYCSAARDTNGRT